MIEGPNEVDVSREVFGLWLANPIFRFASAMREVLAVGEGALGNAARDLLRQKLADNPGMA